MDSRSLQGLSRRTPVVVPTGLGEAYCWRGFNQVIELAAREQFVNGDLEVTALPAGHVTERRRSWRRGARSWSGFAIQVAGNQREREMGGRQEERPGGEALWFLLGGDEIPSDPVEELAEMFSPPRPDVILIPVDDRKPGWLTSRQGMRPEQALESFRVTGGRVFIPLPATWIQESAGRVNAIVTRIRAAWDCHPPLGKELVIPRPGETIEIPGR